MEKEGTACEENYIQNTERNNEDTYTVMIPFKNKLNLEDSKSGAIAKLLYLEKHFSKYTFLNEQYKNFIDEYLQIYYNPHQAVLQKK